MDRAHDSLLRTLERFWSHTLLELFPACPCPSPIGGMQRTAPALLPGQRDQGPVSEHSRRRKQVQRCSAWFMWKTPRATKCCQGQVYTRATESQGLALWPGQQSCFKFPRWSFCANAPVTNLWAPVVKEAVCYEEASSLLWPFLSICKMKFFEVILICEFKFCLREWN